MSLLEHLVPSPAKLVFSLHAVAGAFASLSSCRKNKYLRASLLTREPKVRGFDDLHGRCVASVRSKRVPNPGAFTILEQNTASFTASIDATSSAYAKECGVCPWRPTLNRTGAFEKKTRYEGVDLPLSVLLHHFSYENTVSKKSL